VTGEDFEFWISAERRWKEFEMERNTMRTILILAALLLAGAAAAPAMAQEGISGDAAVTYRWVHTNAAPGDCGCFGLNGGGVSASWNVRGPWSVVADFGSGVAKGAPTVGSSLTLTSGMGGARFELPRLRRNWIHGAHRVQPFGQILVGVAHAGGGAAGIADGTNRFAARAGGGLDVPVSRRFAVRGEVDYFPTTFANGTNDHQNNLLIEAGIVYHWSFAR
jgi:outer membrane immunogenic protein